MNKQNKGCSGNRSFQKLYSRLFDKKNSRKMLSAATAFLMIISFFTAVYYLKSDSHVADIYAGAEDSTEAVSATDAGYETSCKLGTENAETGNTKVFVLRGNQTLAVTNTKNSVLPTGVTTHVLLPLLLLLSGIAGTAIVFIRRKEPASYPFLIKIRQSLVNRKSE